MGRLNLSRRVGETIRIGHDGEIRVTVTRIRGHAVDIAISANRDTPIDREEVFQARQLPAPPESDARDRPLPAPRPILRRRRDSPTD